MDSDDARRVFIVDDHPIFVEGLRGVIEAEEDLCVSGTAACGREAMRQLPLDLPDLVILDIALGDGNGVDFARQLHDDYPDLRILLVSMHDESVYAQRGLQAGACGYVSKLQSPSAILDAIRQVLDGKVFLSDEITNTILQAMAKGHRHGHSGAMADLTDRELAVFHLLGQAYTNSEIADACYISVRTIESYYRRLKEKLNLHNTVELRQHAVRWLQDGRSEGHYSSV